MQHRLALGAAFLMSLATLSAQTPPKPHAPSAPALGAESSTPTSLPVKRVVLFKNGVGYFEHRGHVRGDQDVNIQFTTGQINDVLKSLTAVDLDGGQISGIRYNSIAPLSQRLSTLPIQLGEDVTREQFLTALRGARVTIKNGGAAMTGRLLAVESVSKKAGKDEDGADKTVDVLQVSVMSDAGELRSYELASAAAIQFLEPEVAREVGRYLTLIASSRAKDLRQMTITDHGAGERTLLVSYISEAPVWKSSYRLLLPTKAGDKPVLQGWAIVDNTVGEDWKDVELSLVAGEPQSFIENLSQPIYSRRPVVEVAQGMQLTPQTHASGEEMTAEPGVVGGLVTSGSGGGIGGVMGELSNLAAPTRASTNGYGAGAYIKKSPQKIAKIVDEDEDKSPEWQQNAAAQQAQASGERAGDYFEYKLKNKITVLQNQSVLAPILSSPIEAEKVTLWSPDAKTPLMALWVKNTSGLTLDGGPFAIIDKQSFAGEGVFEEMRPDERRLISFAADTAVRVRNTSEQKAEPFSRVRISKGSVYLYREQRRTTSYEVRNVDTEAREVVIEHPFEQGWRLMDNTPKPEESTANMRRYKLNVAAGKSEKLVIDERLPMEIGYVLTSLDDNHYQQIFAGAKSAKLDEAMKAVLAKNAEIDAVDQKVNDNNREQGVINNAQQRIRENMKALKGSAEEKDLLKRYVGELNAQEDKLAAINKANDELSAQRKKLAAEQSAIIEKLALDEKL